MLINLTNHPSSMWNNEQINASSEFGEIIDLEFPVISSGATEKEISALADKYLCMIKKYKPDPVVLCQGEMCFVFNLVTKLLNNDIKVICAASKRSVQELYKNGNYMKISKFTFSGYREYSRL